MEAELKQTQFLAPEDCYDDSNDAVDTLQQDNITTLEREESPKPTDKDDIPRPAPKKSRKSAGSKGKQPVKKQKLVFDNDETEDAAGHSTEDNTTSLGKYMPTLLVQRKYFVSLLSLL